ncbi:MAG: response regulator transcription factor [Alphaproteobacteria bacterium]|nr:response regulator transcription factor [Alphaproteobacteria bacterium]
MAGLKHGADDYLTKPIDYELLLQRIETRLRQVSRMAERKERGLVKLYKALKKPDPSEPERFRAFAEAAAELLLETDATGTIRFAWGSGNDALAALAGGAPGRALSELLHEGGGEILPRLIAAGPAGRIGPCAVALHGAVAGAGRAELRGLRTEDGWHFFAIARGAKPQTIGHDPESGGLDAQGFATVAKERLRESAAASRPYELTMLVVDGLAALIERGGSTAERVLNELGTALKERSVGGDSIGRLGADRFSVIRDPAADVPSIEAVVETVAGKLGLADALGVSAVSLELTDQGMSEDETAHALTYAMDRFVAAGPGAFTLTSLADSLKALVSEAVTRIGEPPQHGGYVRRPDGVSAGGRSAERGDPPLRGARPHGGRRLGVPARDLRRAGRHDRGF